MNLEKKNSAIIVETFNEKLREKLAPLQVDRVACILDYVDEISTRVGDHLYLSREFNADGTHMNGNCTSIVEKHVRKIMKKWGINVKDSCLPAV